MNNVPFRGRDSKVFKASTEKSGEQLIHSGEGEQHLYR